MEYPVEIKKVSWRLFSQNGIKNTSIEEICSELQISKKTFYKYFKNKEDLLLSIFEDNRSSFEGVIQESIQEKCSPMAIFARFIRQVRKLLSPIPKENNGQVSYYSLSPVIVEELPTLYPKVWEFVDGFRHQMIEKLSHLLETEKDEYIKTEIHTKVISKMLLAIIENVIHPDFLNEHRIPFDEAFDSAIHLLFTGIIPDEKQEEILDMVYTRK